MMAGPLCSKCSRPKTWYSGASGYKCEPCAHTAILDGATKYLGSKKASKALAEGME